MSFDLDDDELFLDIVMVVIGVISGMFVSDFDMVLFYGDFECI